VAKSSISVSEARRLALSAQGFGSPRTEKLSGWKAIAGEIERLHLLQIDSVNVLTRSHYLPLFSRLGNYDRAALDKRSLAQSNRHMFECWAHEASLVPMELHPMMRWRMNRARKGDSIYGSMSQFAKDEKAYLKNVLAFVKSHGPTAQSDLPDKSKGAGGWWGWSKGKLALETLFTQGLLTTSKRESFERYYDLAERVIPAEVLNLATPTERETFRHLIDLSGRALGVGTEFDLRDYFRLPVAETKKAIAEALEEGLLLPVTVEGWKQSAYIHAKAKIPRKVSATALVSPFDPICWDRPRAERLFNFHYRIELYTPAPKRKFGYYVLPFLHGGAFAGRVCLKSDRENGVLLANRSHVEEQLDHDHVAQHLAAELQQMSVWLGLGKVHVGAVGNLAPQLAKHF
jgi:uncharacterized protein YcaQ